MNLSALDLNLLVVLQAVYEERSVVAAARRLHVTPSAVSNALARLRDALGDALFVRSGRGLVATPRGLELGAMVARTMSALNEGLTVGELFQPAQSTREFTIALADNDQVAHLPRIAAAFLRALPQARLRAMSVDALIAGGGLASATADCAIAPALDAPDLHAQLLYEEEAVVLVRSGHPLVPARSSGRKRSLPRELFNGLRHVDTHLALGKPGVGHAAASDVFARHGLVRDVAVVVPTFAAAALVAAQTDLIAALPRRVAEAFAKLSPMQVLELPAPSPRMQLHLVWHERTHHDPGARFVRELVVQQVSGRGTAAKRKRAR